MGQRRVVPADKFDIGAADAAAALGWPRVEPVIGELLEWIQDVNWPVARVLAPLLASIGAPLARHLEPILNGDDDIWKLNVIQELLVDSPVDLIRQVTPTLERIANRPTPGERAEEVDRAAIVVLESARAR